MNKFIEFSKKLSEVFEENAIYLCDLDRSAGDGDHGLTISRGFTEAYAKTSELPEDTSLAEVAKTIGYAMLNSMGGASGPIFSTFFIQTAIILKDQDELDVSGFKKVIDGTIQGIGDLAGTKRNEKTMLDALYGVKDEMDRYHGNDLNEALGLAVAGAKKGAEATIDMIATKGRAKFLQEKSKGFMDAGCWSVVLIFEQLQTTYL